jgi:hypothetical protein
MICLVYTVQLFSAQAAEKTFSPLNNFIFYVCAIVYCVVFPQPVLLFKSEETKCGNIVGKDNSILIFVHQTYSELPLGMMRFCFFRNIILNLRKSRICSLKLNQRYSVVIHAKGVRCTV